MVTRPQPGLDRDVAVLKTLIRDRANRLAIGGLVAEPGRIEIGDQLTKTGEHGAFPP